MKYDFGFIAIGDEITDGDIVNTNTPNFAKHLIKKGFQTGSHISCKDVFDDICSAIEFLKANHKNIIIAGGLGPTEDDLTSEAVAKHFNKELELDEQSWLALEKRMMAKYGKILDKSNKCLANSGNAWQIMPSVWPRIAKHGYILTIRATF